MQDVLEYLQQTGRNPFERKFVIGKGKLFDNSREPTIEEDNAWCDEAVKWFVDHEIFTKMQALLWWGDVADGDVSASPETSYVVNLTGNDLDDLEFVQELIQSARFAPFGKIRQFFPNMFYYDWQWNLFKKLKTDVKKTMLVFYFDNQLHLWESFYDEAGFTTVWLCLLLVDTDLDWKNVLPSQHLSTYTFNHIAERILQMIKISDSTESPLEYAKDAFEKLAQLSIITVYDVWRVIVQFDQAEKVLDQIGFQSEGLQAEKITTSNKVRSLRVGQSVFLARIWYLLYVAKTDDWFNNYVKVINTIDKELLEQPSCIYALEQFQAFAQNKHKPALWISETEFEIIDIFVFLRALYWFIPEDLFCCWSVTDSTSYPIEQEEWQYECWRWNIKDLHHSDTKICKIGLFNQSEFNGSVLKVARIGESSIPVNRYAASDL